MAQKFIVKSWFYEKAQASARKYNFTLVWGHCKAYTGEGKVTADDFIHDTNWEEAHWLYGEQARETEKAILVECDYWNLNRAGRYVTDAPRCKGFKVWIPKSVIYQPWEYDMASFEKKYKEIQEAEKLLEV